MRKDGKADKKLKATQAELVSKNPLLLEIRALIEETKSSVAVAVNTGLTMMYWTVGKRIREEILKNKRAEYGKQIVQSLSTQLTAEYGRGWSRRNLNTMVLFSEVFDENRIGYAVRAQLTWTHIRQLIYIDDPLRRDFYIEMCKRENWSTRMLKKKIDSMLYERTALSKKPEEVIRHELDQLRDEDKMTPDFVFRDPYFLDFLGLKDRYLEKDLEDAILREMETFLLELGSGFTFLARQKRIQIDEDDFYIDLLFYHRDLKRLICIDLKLGNFKAEYKGKMELYLKWLDKYERRESEQMPLGIILCAGKKHEQIELLELGQSGIHVANYCDKIPSQEILQKQFRRAITLSKQRLGAKKLK
jgi:predicted nuclease of restriction endonuclease-like (RecB) superfamily